MSSTQTTMRQTQAPMLSPSPGHPAPGHRRLGSLADIVPVSKPTWKDRLFPGRKPTLVFDPSRCTGCGLCEVACSSRDTGVPAPEAARIQVLRDERAGASFAVFCQHCREPLCLPACPQRAISKGQDGIVAIDARLCVHCGMCQAACPEAAPRRAPDGRIVKCDLCGGDPRCAKACPQHALEFSVGKALSWIKLARWPVQALAFLLLVVVLVGTVCSLSVADFSWACPLGIFQNISASKTIIVTALASAAVLLALAVALGRAFCGWLCPFGFVLDLVGKLTPRRFLLPEFLRTRLAKYGVAAAAVGVSGAVGYQAFCTICPIGTLCRSYGVQAAVGGAEFAVVPALAALELSEKRSWCRYLCPVGALFALCAKIGLLKIGIGASRCKKFSCMRCAETCPMGIIPESDLRQGVSPAVDMSECILCLRCVDTCPHGAAVIRWRWRKATPADRARPAGNTSGGGA